jgi:hypothetical protein
VTDTNARTTANVLLASTGVAAAYVILTRAPLRRVTLRMVRLWLGACVSAYLVDQVRQVWLAHGDRSARH